MKSKKGWAGLDWTWKDGEDGEDGRVDNEIMFYCHDLITKVANNPWRVVQTPSRLLLPKT
jgi:hypothetical protein